MQYMQWCSTEGSTMTQYGPWCVVYGVWCVVYGVWCGQDAVHSILQYGGQHHEAVWPIVCGVWCVVYGG